MSDLSRPDSGIQPSPELGTDVDTLIAGFRRANRMDRAGSLVTVALVAALAVATIAGITRTLSREKHDAGFLAATSLIRPGEDETTSPRLKMVLDMLERVGKL